MLQNEILNVDGTNWLVRQAVSPEAARNEITMARVTGSIGGKSSVNRGGVVTVTADVVRLNDDGTECLPYGAAGGTDHSALVALAKSRADYEHLGRALGQSNFRNRTYAGALAEIDGLVTGELPLYRDPEFLRTEIARIITEAHTTIAEAKAAAQAGKND